MRKYTQTLLLTGALALGSVQAQAQTDASLGFFSDRASIALRQNEQEKIQEIFGNLYDSLMKVPGSYDPHLSIVFNTARISALKNANVGIDTTRDDINAYTIFQNNNSLNSGVKIRITKGMFQKHKDNSDFLAFVLAHEIAHFLAPTEELETKIDIIGAYIMGLAGYDIKKTCEAKGKIFSPHIQNWNRIGC